MESTNTLNQTLIKLEHRVLELTYKHNLSHINSCLTTLPILYEIYLQKPDKFVLSNGHAGLALYVILEHFYDNINAEELLIKHGIHPCRDELNNIHVSTGSLGCGLSIATGLAIGLPDKQIYCIISDGECSEGIIWEALQLIADKPVTNIHVYVNYNGTSAYRSINFMNLSNRLTSFLPYINIRCANTIDYLEKLNISGIDAHYYQLTPTDYASIS